MTAREARNRRRAAERREMKLARKNVIASGATAARPDEAASYQRAEDSRNGSLERREAKIARKNLTATVDTTCEAPQPSTRAEINRANGSDEAALYQRAEDSRNEPALLSEAKAQRKASTGPRTPEGKARSARNSFKHGLYSQQLIIEGEDPAEFDQLRATLRAEHQPLNSTEEILVDELAQHFWRMRRFRALEARAWSPENLDAWCESGLLALIQRSMSSAERAFHKSLATLTKLQKDRPALSQRAEDFNVEFVPQKSSPSRPAPFQGGFVPSECTSLTAPGAQFVSQKPDSALFMPDQSLETAA